MRNLLISSLLLFGSLLGAADMVLTDNARIDGGRRQEIKTGATLRFVTDGPFASDPQIVETGSRPEGKCRALLDGNPGPWAETLAFGSWSKGNLADFIIDLKSQYLVTGVELWSVETPGSRGIDSYEILLSNDGKTFVSVGIYKNQGDLKGKDQHIGIPLIFMLEKPALARYVEFRIKKHSSRSQMVLAEAMVLGCLSGSADAKLLPENQRPLVTLQARGIQESAVKLDWSAYGISDVKAFHLYESEKPFRRIDEPGVTLKKSFGPNLKDILLYPLSPGKTVYWGIVAEFAEGRTPEVAAIQYDVPMPFQCDKFADMLAINHFWGGGGARQQPQRSYQEAWEQVALDLLAKTPFKQIRWWVALPHIVEKLYEKGIGITPFPSDHCFLNGFPMGAYGYTAGNEPDISGQAMEVYTENLKRWYAQGKAQDPRVMISAPTTGLDRHSLEWLDKFYQIGMKQYFDVMDLHTYTKTFSADYSVPAGYPPASPESLLELVPKVRTIMAKYGDADKPMISTEFGFSDCPGSNNPAGNITQKEQAEFLVRGLILHYILGFKRVYVYSFWDEGDDPDFTEHHFGMLDYSLQKKPSYTASCVLGQELGNCTTFTPIKGVKTPDYGWNFFNPVTKRIAVAVWNGASPRLGTFKTQPGKIGIVSMLGKRSSAQTDANGVFRVKFGSAPVYLESAAPVELLKSEPVAPETAVVANDPITMTVPVLVTATKSEVPIPVTLTNATAKAYAVKVTLEDAAEMEVATRSVTVPAKGKTTVDFVLEFGKYAFAKWKINCSYEGASDSVYHEISGFARKLATAPGVLTLTLEGVTEPVVSLASDTIEIIVDPARGGRILEIFDRKRGGNQVMLDYAKLAVLPSVPYAYCIWDTLRCSSDQNLALHRETRYEYTLGKDSVSMRAGKGITLEKRYMVSGNAVTLDVSIVNCTSKPQMVRYYMHSEYTVGGTGDNTVDELIFPVDGKELTIPFWSGLGERKTPKIDRGYWRVLDTVRKVELCQEFDFAKFQPPRLWFGTCSYNLNMETRDIKLAPGETWTGKLTWRLQ